MGTGQDRTPLVDFAVDINCHDYMIASPARKMAAKKKKKECALSGYV